MRGHAQPDRTAFVLAGGAARGAYEVGVMQHIMEDVAHERADDVMMLAHHFAVVYAAAHGKRVTGLSPEALDRLRRYPWPGNVRELQNCMERAVALTDRAEISVEDLPDTVRHPDAAPGMSLGALVPLAQVERQHILGVFDAVRGNKRLAAHLLPH